MLVLKMSKYTIFEGFQTFPLSGNTRSNLQYHWVTCSYQILTMAATMSTTNSNPTTMPTTFPESLALGLFFSTFFPLVLPTVCSFTAICGVSVGGSSPFSAKIENRYKNQKICFSDWYAQKSSMRKFVHCRMKEVSHFILN